MGKRSQRSEKKAPSQRAVVIGTVAVSALLALAYLAGVIVVAGAGGLSGREALVYGLLGVLALVFLGLFVVAAFGEPEPRLGIRSHWGGLGGGVGGWTLSRSLVFLMVALSFGGMLAYAVTVPRAADLPAGAPAAGTKR